MLYSKNVLFDISGEEKKAQAIDGLIDKFHKAHGDVSDTMAFGLGANTVYSDKAA